MNEIFNLYNLGPQGLSGDGAEAFWRATFPDHSPAEIYQTLKRKMPAYESGETIEISDYRDGSFEIDMNFYSGGVRQSTYRFCFENGDCHFANAEVFFKVRNASATQLLFNVEEIFEILDIGKVTTGTRDAGSYAWLPLGWLPFEIDSIEPMIRYNLAHSSIGAVERQFVLDLLKRDDPNKPLDPKIAWVIADMDTQTSGDPPLTHGQKIMANTRWQGVRDRNDDESQAKFMSHGLQKLTQVEK